MRSALHDRTSGAAKIIQPSLGKAILDHERLREHERRAEAHAVPARRQYKGGFKPAPANDNQDWPLLQALRRDGLHDLVDVAQRYRAIHDSAGYPGLLKGTTPDDAYGLVRRPASKSDPDGRTKEVMRVRTAPQPAKWNGDTALIASIDAKADLARLRSLLGAYVAPFEEAVIDGETLTSIGAVRGAGQHASGAGKLVVKIGLEAIQGELLRMDSERHL